MWVWVWVWHGIGGAKGGGREGVGGAARYCHLRFIFVSVTEEGIMAAALVVGLGLIGRGVVRDLDLGGDLGWHCCCCFDGVGGEW